MIWIRAVTDEPGLDCACTRAPVILLDQNAEHEIRAWLVNTENGQQSLLDPAAACRTRSILVFTVIADPGCNSGKAIAIRLAEDGFDVCINDVEANSKGIDEVRSTSTTILPIVTLGSLV